MRDLTSQTITATARINGIGFDRGYDPPAPAHPSDIVLFQSTGLPQCVSEHELDLTVERAQIVVCPPLQGSQHRRIEPDEKGFAFRHSPTGRSFRY